MDLLHPGACPFQRRDDLLPPFFRQVVAVLVARPVHDPHRRERQRDQLLRQFVRLRRRREAELRVVAQPAAELRVVERRVQHVALRGVVPRRQLVAPHEVLGRAAQPVRLLAGEPLELRPVRELDLQRRAVVRRTTRAAVKMVVRQHAEDARLALDHRAANVALGWSDQPDPASCPFQRLPLHPLRPGNRFPEPAPGEDQPERPASIGCLLLRAAGELPVREQELL